MSDVLIDTNVVVYAYDVRDRDKQLRALEVLRRLVADGRGRLSAQVLGEFLRVATRKLVPPLTPGEAVEQAGNLAASWPVVPITAFIVLEAGRGVEAHRLSYWDAQLWATARLNQIEIVLSEDFADGRLIDGVRFRNPFTAAFDLAALG